MRGEEKVSFAIVSPRFRLPCRYSGPLGGPLAPAVTGTAVDGRGVVGVQVGTSTSDLVFPGALGMDTGCTRPGFVGPYLSGEARGTSLVPVSALCGPLPVGWDVGPVLYPCPPFRVSSSVYDPRYTGD